MKIVLYGATGNSGQRILQELTTRGHEVTAVARNITKLSPTVKAVSDDLNNVDVIASEPGKILDFPAFNGLMRACLPKLGIRK